MPNFERIGFNPGDVVEVSSTKDRYLVLVLKYNESHQEYQTLVLADSGFPRDVGTQQLYSLDQGKLLR